MAAIPDELRTNPRNLIDTRWVFVWDPFREPHAVAVVDVRDDRAHVVSLYTHEFRHWWARIDEIFSEYGAFWYVGQGIQLEDFSPGRWLFSDREDSMGGPWLVRTMGANVGFYPRRDDENRLVHYVCPLTNLLTHFRVATTEEALVGERLMQTRQMPVETEWPFTPMPAPTPPAPTQDMEAVLRPFWQRLTEEDEARQ